MSRDAAPSGALSRRAALAGAWTLAVGAACDVLSVDPDSDEPKRRFGADKGKEAPELIELVKAGELPPVEDRLPVEPLVVHPVERMGRYGGTWRTALFGASDFAWLDRTIGYEPLLRWDRDGTGPVPNLAERVEASGDGREFTIVLREGMKWSDGKPFTAADLAFAWHDVLSNTELSPVPPAFMVSGDEPGTLEEVDERTVQVVFARPSGLFPAYLAFNARQLTEHPRHYLQRFHAEHNPDVEQLVRDEGFSAWPELFLSKADRWQNKDLPRHHAWALRRELGEGERVVAERNPYYFKVDPDASQLPYLSEVVFDVTSDAEVIMLKATNGELDFHARHINTQANKPVLAASRDDGAYDFKTLTSTLSTDMVIAVNLTHRDPVKREVFRNRDFRIGLSYAINRTELRDIVFQRQGESHQAAPVADSEFYDEEFATQFTTFDVDLAGEHLDRAGFTDRDPDGFRLGPDGNRISFAVEVPTPAFIPIWPDAMQLVVDHWKQVGIDARVKPADRSLYEERIIANEPDATVWPGEGGLLMEMYDPRWYFPYSFRSTYAIPWAEWFESRGAAGEEPPAEPRRQMELFRQLTEEPEEARRADVFRQILRIAKEQFYCIGTIHIPKSYSVVRTAFRNVPDELPEWWGFNTPALASPEQFFIEP